MPTTQPHRTRVVESFTAMRTADGQQRTAVWRLLESGNVSICEVGANTKERAGSLRWSKALAVDRVPSPARAGSLRRAVESLGWTVLA
jgi:hypothetical protein